MLLGAILLVAQLGFFQLRQLLSSGKSGVLKEIRLDTVGTAGHFKKALQQAPLTELMEYLDKSKSGKIIESLLQHADDLDYLQGLITSVGNKAGLNPSLLAVIQAYSRRRFSGRFKKEGQSVELDTLLHQGAKNDKDDDNVTLSSAPMFCFSFQRGNCTFKNCKYQRRCSLCPSISHGAAKCPGSRLLRRGVKLLIVNEVHGVKLQLVKEARDLHTQDTDGIEHIDRHYRNKFTSTIVC